MVVELALLVGMVRNLDHSKMDLNFAVRPVRVQVPEWLELGPERLVLAQY